MLYDLFMVADEKELILLRLAENYGLVDKFIIVESIYDQCGNPKPLVFEENKEYYKNYLDKVYYYKIEDKAPRRFDFDWSNEIYVRNNLANALNQYTKENNIILDGNDKILFGDLDELVNNNALKEALKLNQTLSFTHLFNYCKLDYYAPARKWYGSILTDFSTLCEYGGFQEMRKVKDFLPHYEDENNPSWHFSGIGANSFSVNWLKWKTRIEPKIKIEEELKSEYEKYFNKCVFEDKYFFYSDNISRRDEDLKLSILPIHLLPSFVQKNIDTYKHLLYPVNNKVEQLNLL